MLWSQRAYGALLNFFPENQRQMLSVLASDDDARRRFLEANLLPMIEGGPDGIAAALKGGDRQMSIFVAAWSMEEREAHRTGKWWFERADAVDIEREP
jgi:hypothetical protein